MTKKNIYKAAGFAILAVSAVFAVKGSGKFGQATSLFVSTAAGGCIQISSAIAPKFSTVGSVQATIKTNAGNLRKMWQTACNPLAGKRVYFKP